VLPNDPLTLFFHDVPNPVEWVHSLRPHAWATQNAPATGAAYFNIPTAYLLCEEDRATPLPVQQMLVERARRNGAEIETDKIATGHTPWLVKPDEVVAWIKKRIGVSE
jgi:pimeloyl-ACP methyl ester carboxylesterase